MHVYGPESFNGFGSISFIQSVFDSTFIVINYVKINMPYPIVKCTAVCGSFGVLNERQISYSNKVQMHSYNIYKDFLSHLFTDYQSGKKLQVSKIRVIEILFE